MDRSLDAAMLAVELGATAEGSGKAPTVDVV
jgi:hypothetical protein